MAFIIAAFLFLSSCALIDFTTQEEKRAQAILMMEAQAWQKKQEQRILEIAARLIGAAETVEPLKFYFAARSSLDVWTRVDVDGVNAWTDGDSVWVSRGMMRFLKSDDELALVLAHEMAHAYRGHIPYVRAKHVIEAALGAVLDIFAPGSGRAAVVLFDVASKKFDRDHEREADLYGLVWAHKAGFDVSVAKELWRRMAIEVPESIESGFLSSHPSSAERFLSLERLAAMLKDGVDPSEVIALARTRSPSSWY